MGEPTTEGASFAPDYGLRGAVWPMCPGGPQLLSTMLADLLWRRVKRLRDEGKTDTQVAMDLGLLGSEESFHDAQLRESFPPARSPRAACHIDGCTSTALHAPEGHPEAVACWAHAGDWPEVAPG